MKIKTINKHLHFTNQCLQLLQNFSGILEVLRVKGRRFKYCLTLHTDWQTCNNTQTLSPHSTQQQISRVICYPQTHKGRKHTRPIHSHKHSHVAHTQRHTDWELGLVWCSHGWLWTNRDIWEKRAVWRTTFIYNPFPLTCKDTYQQDHSAYLCLLHCQLNVVQITVFLDC